MISAGCAPTVAATSRAPPPPARSPPRRRHGCAIRDCRTRPRGSGTPPCARRPRLPPAWSPHNPSTRSRYVHSREGSFARAAHGLAPPPLHGAQDAAHDIELVAIELRAIEEPPQPLHQVPGTVLEIDFVENLVQVRVESVRHRPKARAAAPVARANSGCSRAMKISYASSCTDIARFSEQ